MKQEKSIYLEEVGLSRKRMNTYLNALYSLKKGMKKKESNHVLANVLMLARSDLIRRNKFNSELESDEQLKCWKATNDLIDLLASLLVTYLEEDLLSYESLNSLMYELQDGIKNEMDYATYVASKGTGLSQEELKQSGGYSKVKEKLNEFVENRK